MSDQGNEPEIPLLLMTLMVIFGAIAFAAGYVISSGIAMTYLRMLI